VTPYRSDAIAELRAERDLAMEQARRCMEMARWERNRSEARAQMIGALVLLVALVFLWGVGR
jgi:predicted nucleic acid-binding Zn ribbon protein